MMLKQNNRSLITLKYAYIKERKTTSKVDHDNPRQFLNITIIWILETFKCNKIITFQHYINREAHR
jgi:hypothetical protein